ncbi:MAG TPA: hypothetical protein VN132_08660 [Bdellovibrio sp.]|nr:hypothetical protein [Bdellovibrio sp.]
MSSQSPSASTQEEPSPKKNPPSHATHSMAIRPEPVLFADNQNKLNGMLSPPRRPQNSTGTPLPTSSSVFRSTPLWSDQAWQVWQGVRVVAAKDFSGNEGKQLGSLGSYVLLEESSHVSDEHQFSSDNPIPIYNSARNRSGVISGVFMVKVSGDSDFQSLILDHNLKIKGATPSVGIYYVTSQQEPFDLLAMMDTLRKDPRVSEVNLEVVTQNYGKK